tara:strand:+ start:289 stop:1470 length:1182 start_codon:yes stop_codon:yes gene_type:complete
MLELVLEPLIGAWVDLLAQSVRVKQIRGRGILCRAVKVSPLINKEARDLWRAESRAPYLLAFCRYLFAAEMPNLDMVRSLRYLDGLPLDTLDVVPENNPATQMLAQRANTIETIHKKRVEMATKLHKASEEVLAEFAGYETVEYPVPNLPTEVRCFIAHVELTHAHYAVHPSYPRFFRTCQRKGCNRPTLMQPPDAPVGQSSDMEYWACCRDGKSPPPEANLPSDMSFCSHGCFVASNREFQSMVSFKIETPPCRLRGKETPSPAKLFRAALSRNSALERSLRTKEVLQTHHYPSSLADRERVMRDRIAMLSVDAGLLFAAMRIMDMPRTLRPRRALPRTEDWRKDAACYLTAVERVRILYLMYGGGRITKTGNERWLNEVKGAALRIFGCER